MGIYEVTDAKRFQAVVGFAATEARVGNYTCKFHIENQAKKVLFPEYAFTAASPSVPIDIAFSEEDTQMHVYARLVKTSTTDSHYVYLPIGDGLLTG